MIGSDLDRALECAEITMEAGERAGLEEFLVAGRMLAEGVAAFCGDPGARDRIRQLVEIARQQGWDELAWRGYVSIVVSLMDQGELREAQRAIEETITHTTDRDLSTARLWHISLRAATHAFTGRWSAAREDAEAVIATGALDGSLWPHLALGLTAMRVGDDDAASHLDRSWAVALTVDEPMRYLPVLIALAEQMWMTDVPDPRITELAVPRLGELAATADTHRQIGSLVIWLRRLGLDVAPPIGLPEPFHAHLHGRYAEASARWRRAGSPFAEALALADSPAPDDRVQAVSLLDRLGAVGTADRLRRELRRSGVASVPKRPSETTRANPGGLTNRQLEVARLLARGFTNSEIATQVFISPKTAEHHVAAILTKLRLPSRRDVVLHAAEFGLD